MNVRWLLASLPLVTACGSTSPDDHADGGIDHPPACTERDETTTHMVPRIETGPGSYTYGSWRLDAVTATGAVIAHADDAPGGAQHVALIDTNVNELATLAAAANSQLRVSPVSGTSCAVIKSAKVGTGYGCAGQPFDLSTIDLGGNEIHAVPTTDALLVYGQTFASFTLVERTASGTWTEDEQYESSISYPTDAVLARGTPLACFINTDGHAVLRYPGVDLTTSTTAAWCELAVEGATVHVLTDAGYTSLPLGSIVARGTLTLTPLPAPLTRPVRLVILEGQPHALYGGLDAQLMPVAGGAPITMPLATGNVSVAVDWDAADHALNAVTTQLDTTGPGPLYPQTIRRRHLCM